MSKFKNNTIASYFCFTLLLSVHSLISTQTCAQTTLQNTATTVEGKIHAILSEFHEKAEFPGGTIGFVLPDGTAGSISIGEAFTETKKPMNGDHRMMAGSTGKTFFAALALQLVDEDVLDLDAKISTYLADKEWFSRLPNAETITLRMLLNHTSGIPRYVMLPSFVNAMIENPNRSWDTVEILEFVFDTEPLFDAGEGWSYADTNFIVAGYIIEKVTGDTCYNQISKRILKPNNLLNIVPTTSRDISGLAGGYVNLKANIFQLKEEQVVKDGRYVINPQFEWAGGGFASTPKDLAHWAHLLYSGEILSVEMQEEMQTTVEAKLGPTSRYGIGFMQRESESGPAIGHSGYFPGYLTDMWFYADHNLALSFQINTTKMSREMNPNTMVATLDKCAKVILKVD